MKSELRESNGGGLLQTARPPLSVGGELLGSFKTTQALGRWLTFPPQLARAIGMEESVFLMNLVFLASDEENWVERNSAQLEKETTLTYKQQTRVRDRLVGLGLLEVRTNRVKHETLYRVVEERYDALVALLGRKREFDELTFGSNSTLPKVNSTNLPKGSSLIKKEEVLKEERKEEEKETPSPLPLCKEERKAIPKPVREPKIKRSTLRTLQPRPERVPPPKPPEVWNWFAKLWNRYAEVFPVSRPEHWGTVEALYYKLTPEVMEERLSRWLEMRGGKISAWTAIDFLNECELMGDKQEFGADVPVIKAEE